MAILSVKLAVGWQKKYRRNIHVNRFDVRLNTHALCHQYEVM
jgi:hypothetical protein